MTNDHHETIWTQGLDTGKLGALAGKTYVITGANNGAGFDATRVFLAKGAKVVMMNRNNEKYTAWKAYAQSKLAQMMFAYELQRRVQSAGKNVQVQVCHPGASRTNLLNDTVSVFNKIVWSIASRIIAQSAEKGFWPEVMCAKEETLETEKLYGPTRRAEMVGPVDECPLDKCVLDQDMATKLWTLSDQKTSLSWSP